MMKNTKHEIGNIEKLKSEGYVASYRLAGDELRDTTTNKTYEANQLHIDKEYRYEGMSNPSDNSILYAISADDGSKGSLLVAYGPTGNLELSEFIKDIPTK